MSKKLVEKLKKIDFSQLSEEDLKELYDEVNALRNKTVQQIQQRRTEKRREQERKQRELIEQQKAEMKREEEERVRKITEMELSLDWENFYATDEEANGEEPLSIGDAFLRCLNRFGYVDIEYIAQRSASDLKTVILTLKGAIYQNPSTWEECFYKGWETAEEYLSGNIKEKIQAIYRVDKKYGDYFADNLEALRHVFPRQLTSDEIFVTLGSPWIPAYVIEDFLVEKLYYKSGYYQNTSEVPRHGIKPHSSGYMPVVHDEITGTWEIPDKNQTGIMLTKTYGTEKMNALRIVENTLNMRAVSVCKEVRDSSTESGWRRVVDEKETLLAVEKQKKLIAEFQEWIWQDEKRKRRLEEIYNSKFCVSKTRHFDGSYLELPGLSDQVSLYLYQKNAVARIIQSDNTLLAHDVGAGKTYIMIAAGMELKRLGRTSKNVYVVPNSIIAQWESIFRTMYPNAKLLVIEPKTFKPAKRNSMLKKIRDEEYDGIIIAYSCFETIGISKEFLLEQLRENQKKIETAIKDGINALNTLPKLNDKLKKQISELIEQIHIAEREQAETQITFDELGIDALFLDEAHNYKNLPLETKMDKIAGINKTGSVKCANMLEKVLMVQKGDGEKKGRVVFATGTPITNSVAEVYSIQKYLQSGTLALLDLGSFDAWAGMFGERVDDFEIDVDTSNFRIATRFSRFHNVPELTNMLSAIADFHHMDTEEGLPLFNGYADETLPKTKELDGFLKGISLRADDIRRGSVSRKKDNMLLLTTDGRKAALDLRLLNYNLNNPSETKSFRCAENVFRLWMETYWSRGTQLVFCDVYASGVTKFNVYEEFKKNLVTFGIPEDEIAFVGDADTAAQREQLFRKVNDGEIRVLIGSTFKLGIGVNVQQRLVAVHHLDVPWRPADMTQREGRIIRQGNENKEVFIYRYITEGSFDAYSWQLLETKQKFISDLLQGFSEARSADEIDDTVLDYGEVKALAVGDPRIRERVETLNELNKYKTLQARVIKAREDLEAELSQLPGKIQLQTSMIEAAERNLTFITEHHPDEDETAQTKKQKEAERQEFRHELYRALLDNTMETREREFGEYRGFSIHLPAGMKFDKPYVILERDKGRYRVELSSSEVGNLIRIDHFLEKETFEAYLNSLKEGLQNYVSRKKDIERELKREESYTDRIDELTMRLELIDKELGVNKDGK